MGFPKKSGKEGSAHLEMVVSFTLFISFSVFLLYYLTPAQTNPLPDVILNELETTLLDYSGVELVSFLVKPNETNCLSVDVSGLGISGNSTVRNSTGAVISSQIDSGTLAIGSSNGESYYVYVSEEFNAGTQTCSSGIDYNLGEVRRSVVLSNSSLKELENNYSAHYDSLKSELGLTSTVEFAIVSGTYLNASKNIPSGTEVLSKVMIGDVLYADGTIEKREITLKIW